jgi:hypothetical protein
MKRDDHDYLELLLAPMRECRSYRPAFGQADDAGISLVQFRKLYGADQLYHWVGLDSDLMYAAHKAAGGMTSIYRQLGVGCERLLCAIVRDTLSLSDDEASWRYEYEKEDGKIGIHTLDCRIDTRHLAHKRQRDAMKDWLSKSAISLGLDPKRASGLQGTVLEIRQGYKSADSKRQNADLRFGMRAFNEGYLPVIAVVSSQVSEVVCRRYRASQMLVLVGTSGTAQESTFSFFRDAVGHDLAGFFARNSAEIRREFSHIVGALLSAD